MQLKPGTLLHGGTYRIEKTLGQGSFGITYLAEHTSLGKKVAIKEFFMRDLNFTRSADGSITGMSEGSLSYNYGQKFKKEALNLSHLDHPNIVRVTDSFDENGTFYYVMDYIDGMNLNDYIKRYPVSQEKAVEIIKQVAEALQYMHEEKHMLHLDLKPGNIMRRKGDGHIFLIDFGLSKHYDSNGEPESSTNIGLGTEGYAPVEQGNKAKNGEFRPTIDVYALGATLYKLLTRETPPPASYLVSDEDLLMDSLKEHGITGKLADAINNAMLPSVKKRTQTVRAFIESLPEVIDKPVTTEIEPDTKDEETEVLGSSAHSSGEETELANGVKPKHPNFDESKYIIPQNYQNFFTKTSYSANNGDVEAMLALGMMFLRGKGITQDLTSALLWFRKLKELGDDRGEKLVNQWIYLQNKYTPQPQTTTEEENTSSNSNTVLGIFGLIIVFAIIFAVVKSCTDKQNEEKARIELQAQINSSQDFYRDVNGNPYCVINGNNEYVDAIPDGYHILHYEDNDSQGRKSYTGNFLNGARNDTNATMIWKNGDTYEGGFSNGELTQGTYTVKSDGSYFVGTFYKNNPYTGTWCDCDSSVLQTISYGN